MGVRSPPRKADFRLLSGASTTLGILAGGQTVDRCSTIHVTVSEYDVDAYF